MTALKTYLRGMLKAHRPRLWANPVHKVDCDYDPVPERCVAVGRHDTGDGRYELTVVSYVRDGTLVECPKLHFDVPDGEIDLAVCLSLSHDRDGRYDHIYLLNARYTIARCIRDRNLIKRG